jgi:23S rRNA (cytosine1962-C5)-methyltransferase
MHNLLTASFARRQPFTNFEHTNAVRIFNGFTEGDADFVLEIYGTTLVIHNYSKNPTEAMPRIELVLPFLQEQFPWIDSILLKTRQTKNHAEQCGRVLYGETLANKIMEDGVWYALDLQVNSDTSFYLDTRHLREWLKAKMRYKRVFNTFAYTSSLGVAAQAGGAIRVFHSDRQRKYLEIAKKSYLLNGYSVDPSNFGANDFFKQVGHFKSAQTLFDCIIVDPPFFSVTDKGRVDMVNDNLRLLNKVRPLIANDGFLVAINNALYVSGEEFERTLAKLCADGYLEIETRIPVPEDCVGINNPTVWPSDPTPYNHPTKIAILRVRRKDGRL